MNVVWLSGACLGGLLVLALFGVIAWLIFHGQTLEEERQAAQGRDDALKRLLEERDRMRSRRPDFVSSAQKAHAEAIQQEIEQGITGDPRKAAGNLQRLMR